MRWFFAFLVVNLGWAFPPLTMDSIERNPQGRTWPQHAGDERHTGMTNVPSQEIAAIRWSCPVDLVPFGNAHYGSLLVTRKNTVIVPVKTASTGSFRIEARNNQTGAVLYTIVTDYAPVSANWVSMCSPSLTHDNRLVIPAAGGSMLIKQNADDPNSPVTRICFYGMDNFNRMTDSEKATIRICSPITVGPDDTLYYGVRSSFNTTWLDDCIVRTSKQYASRWTTAPFILPPGVSMVPANHAAPALAPNGWLYACINANESGVTVPYMVALNPVDMTTLAKAPTYDVLIPSQFGVFSVISTSNPVIGPDGDVYAGILESPIRNSRGWLMHWNASLTVRKNPGAFGWDNTPAIVPRKLVPWYLGNSKYLLFSKYNYYGAAGQPDKVALLDPNDLQVDIVSGKMVMKEVMTLPSPGNFEWCINSAVVDTVRGMIYINNEDGVLYRYNLGQNRIDRSIRMTGGIREAYTNTLIGPDGTVYATNMQTMFAIGDPKDLRNGPAPAK